jgi:hypothetical protein
METKSKLLTELNVPRHLWSSKEFLREIPEAYFLYQCEVFFVETIWKILIGVLVLLPILLLIAYATLIERKLLSAIQ